MHRAVFAAFACAAIAVLPASAAARTDADPLSVTGVEPFVGGKVVVERVAAGDAGQDERWRLSLDVWVKNSGTATATLKRIVVGYPGAPVTVTETTYGLTIAAGKSAKIEIPENRVLPFPVAPSISVRLEFDRQTLFVNRSLAEHRSQAAGGAYLFPGKRADLPDGWYWTDGQSHIPGSNHRASSSQRFAYDFVVRRWDGKHWTSRKADAKGNKNENSLIWGLPVYAMADGWILRCGRSKPDNEPGEKTSGAGNFLRIVHAPGEVALYAHMRKDSIPAALCPNPGVNAAEAAAVRVKAGQMLGRVGNTGQSTGPHLHVHVDTTGNDDGQGRPLHFRNVRTRYAGADWDESPPCDARNRSFAVAKGASPNWRQLVEPLWPAGAGELTKFGMREACFQDYGDEAVASGYKPVWFDGYEVGGTSYVNVVFRPGGGDWVLRNGLTSAAYQSQLEDWDAKGYRLTHVESYRSGDEIRYAFIAEKLPAQRTRIAAYHGRTPAQHQQLANQLKADGYAPLAVSVVSLNGKLSYTALWQSNAPAGWLLASTIERDDYQHWVEINHTAKRDLAYVNAYNHDGKVWFSAIVRRRTPLRAARHDLDADALGSTWRDLVGKGLRTQAITGYRTGDTHRFAALWR